MTENQTGLIPSAFPDPLALLQLAEQMEAGFAELSLERRQLRQEFERVNVEFTRLVDAGQFPIGEFLVLARIGHALAETESAIGVLLARFQTVLPPSPSPKG